MQKNPILNIQFKFANIIDRTHSDTIQAWPTKITAFNLDWPKSPSRDFKLFLLSPPLLPSLSSLLLQPSFSKEFLRALMQLPNSEFILSSYVFFFFFLVWIITFLLHSFNFQVGNGEQLKVLKLGKNKAELSFFFFFNVVTGISRFQCKEGSQKDVLDAKSPPSSRIILRMLPVDLPGYLEMLQQAVVGTDQTSLTDVMKIRTCSLRTSGQNYNRGL